MTKEDLDAAARTAERVLAADNIWDAVEVLTNELGLFAGRHLEKLLCREIKANQGPPDCNRAGNSMGVGG